MNDVFLLPRAISQDDARVATLHDQLVEAFQGELRARLPRLVAAASRLRKRGVAVTGSTLRQIVAEVHTIATSSVVVGLHEAARSARACEHRLLAYVDGDAPPAVVVDEALGQLDLLIAALQSWQIDELEPQAGVGVA